MRKSTLDAEEEAFSFWMKYGRAMAERYCAQRNSVLDSSQDLADMLQRLAVSCDHRGAILDIGCGPGCYSSRLRRTLQDDVALHLLDHSPPMIEFAKIACQGQANTHFALADAGRMPYELEIFSMCFAVNVIHQVDEMGAVLAEISRVLTTDGILVIATPSRDRLRDFPVFAANTGLAERQESSLPRLADILSVVKERELSLTLREQSYLQGSGSVPSEDYLSLVRGRFLSILDGCSDAEVSDYAANTEKFLREKKLTKVKPYWYEVYVIGKEAA